MSELVKVYSPNGEVFENSPFNARDLVTHAGWSYNAPASVKVLFPEVEVAKIAETVSEPVIEEKVVEIEEAVEVSKIEEVSQSEEVEEVKPSISRGRPSKK